MWVSSESSFHKALLGGADDLGRGQPVLVKKPILAAEPAVESMFLNSETGSAAPVMRLSFQSGRTAISLDLSCANGYHHPPMAVVLPVAGS